MSITQHPFSQPQLELKVEAMACATSLKEEFGQYKTELSQLELRLQGHFRQTADPTVSEPLRAIAHMLHTIDRFQPERASAIEIHHLAERASTLIGRVNQTYRQTAVV